MKILTFRKSLEQSLKKAGHDVTAIIFKPMHASRPEAIRSLIDTFKRLQPDVFFFAKEMHVKRPILKRLREVCPNTVFIMWYGDQRGCVPPLITERKGLLDGIMINNADPKQFDMYRKFGIKHVGMLCNGFFPEVFKPRPEITEKYQVFFGGNNFNPKKFPLSSLRYDLITTLYKRFSTSVYGKGWPFTTHHLVQGNEYCYGLCEASVNIGINHYDVVRYYDRRIFECIPTQKPHFTYYIPGMEKDFENHKHLVWFKSKDEAIKLIAYYLKRPEEALQIGINGRKLCLEKHTMDVRAIQISSFIKKKFNIE